MSQLITKCIFVGARGPQGPIGTKGQPGAAGSNGSPVLVNANSAIFQPYHGENKVIFNEMMMKSALYWIFIVLAH
jgi:hypothetical protein